MRLGIAHHYGWAVAVTATANHEVVDRRRIELIEPGLPPAPIHHSVMYCQVLAELARARRWKVCVYNAKDVESEAIRLLGERADDVLRSPRAKLGPPWSKDHRTALAATIVAT